MVPLFWRDEVTGCALPARRTRTPKSTARHDPSPWMSYCLAMLTTPAPLVAPAPIAKKPVPTKTITVTIPRAPKALRYLTG